MIPNAIQKDHIIAALAEIDRKGVPPGRESRRFILERDGKKYPPKYVIALACQIATGKALGSSMFGGGVETNRFLGSRGFTIASAGSASAAIPAKPVRQRAKRPPAGVHGRHNERCPACKPAVESLLTAIYGAVEKNPHIDVPAAPKAYAGNPKVADALARIYDALQKHRGFTEFVRRETLPRCDFLVPNPGFLVEFDESQHFTEPRRLALSLYPDDLALGFDRQKWMRLCEELRPHDDDPPFRDEQRAWYDTLRDFLPLTRNMSPTIRLYSRQIEWCNLDPANPADVETFRQILGERADFWSLDFRVPAQPLLARLAINGAWAGDLRTARKLLTDVSAAWPKNLRILCISTCGAFLRFPWPATVPHQKDNLRPDPSAIKAMDAAARAVCEQLLDGGLREELAKRADYLTIGIDTTKLKISTTQNHIPEDHAELVYVANLQTGELHFTGKSYPTVGQAKGLFRIPDLETHFVQLGENSAVVLGCHDLTMFNPRGNAVAGGWRADVIQCFADMAGGKRPTILLHHPHSTVKVRTWLAAWTNLLQHQLTTIHSYLGTGCYSYRDPGGGLNRDNFDAVLSSTKSADVVDVIVRLAATPAQRRVAVA